MDTKVWFAARGQKTEAAQEICSTCRVRAQCADEALVRTEKFGIWGGRSEREGRQERHRRRRSAEAHSA
jgi:WhiB family transcriptional regulator, redox-sensing transcriptional regulator